MDDKSRIAAKELTGAGEKTGKETLEEKTVMKGLGLSGNAMGANAAAVDVKDGKIVRIRPLRYDSKYKPEEFNPWKVVARGKVFEPTMKSLLPPHSMAYKQRVYSPNRIKYPLKRVDFNAEGDRHSENRGTSGYVRISWDEAVETIVKEIKRVQEKYGPSAIFCQADGHGETKTVHASHGCNTRLLNLVGGCTIQARNPGSWEGWHWGAKHAWGMEPVGQNRQQTNLVLDIAENSEQLLFWGCDVETTAWGWGGQMASRLCYWFSELRIKSIYVCPDLNYAAAVHADKWIPVLPNTDAALQLAVAYTWITEGTYDKEYLATHTTGFEKFSEYVLGKEDGTPKTPDWASSRCGVPVWTIKALAREWASRRTSIVHGNGGPYIRGPYATEPARLEVLLLAMQGLGKPGCTQFKTIEWANNAHCLPRSQMGLNLNAANRGGSQRNIKYYIPKTLVHEAILNPPISWYGMRLHGPVEDQFKKSTYPPEGCPEIHMIWTDTPCFITCYSDGNKMIEAFRSPKIEFILAQQPWLEDDCLFADIVLPVNTKMEEEDIGNDVHSGQFNTLLNEEKCIEPIGESRSDYEIVGMIAEKMGLLEKYTEGKTIEEWIKLGFETSGVAGHISYQEFKEKGYFVAPTDPEWQKYRRGLSEFYENPEKTPLSTPSGKIEFYSQRLSEQFPSDEERPPVPHYIPFGETHQESRLHKRSRTYPLLVVSNHARWRCNAELDDVSWLREISTCKVKGSDGYYYEPLWINPVDAATRNIQNGDIVRVYNERGGVLGGAYVTERILPGAVSMDHGARYDPIVPGKLDRGGAINSISPSKTTSKNAPGYVVSGFLAEVVREDLEALKMQYPAAFSRPIHPSAGACLESFLGAKQKR